MEIRPEEIMNIVTVGHVDHGKSTVVGRLMADTGVLPEGKLEQIRENCRRNSKPFEYAFLLDALKNEQAQGITIDTARCFFKTAKRNYIIIDAPGHIEFLKNMVTGASRAEAALLVIDALRGVEENTRRHGYFLSMLGIRQVAVLVNKMDLVAFDRRVYDQIIEEYADFLHKIGIEPASFIPVSGMQGDNIANHSANMPWYDGLNVLEQLDLFKSVPEPADRSLRLPVQGVYKFTADGDARRIIAGTVDAGRVRVGDRVVLLPSGKRTSVQSLEYFNGPSPDSFSAGQAAGLTMTEQIFIHRGEMVCREDQSLPQVGVRMRVNLFWLGKQQLVQNKTYFLKCGTAKVEMRVAAIERIVNASDLSCTNRTYVEKNEVAECVLALERPIAYDLAGDCEATSRFVIVDDYEIAGGGIITESLPDEDYDQKRLRWSADSITADERRQLTRRRGLVVWLTGLSGAGKTTLAQEAERRLLENGQSVYVLDGDRLRRGLNAGLGFSAEDRRENIRRTAEVANLFRDAGLIVFVALISPYRESRAEARRICGDDFMEVWVRAEVETCVRRDPKGHYSASRQGQLSGFTGVSAPYEEPEAPDLVIDTQSMDEEGCVNRLLAAIRARLAE